jgi:hypothetical protein
MLVLEEEKRSGDKQPFCGSPFPFQAREAWTFPSTPSIPLSRDTAAAP